MDKKIREWQFNSVKRFMAYKKYNSMFNGEVLSVPKPSKDKCTFDESNGLLWSE
jgi:hypothetical protein